MAAPVAPPKGKGGLGRLFKDKRVLAGVIALAVLLVFYLRSQSASSTTATTGVDPNAVDPATGLTYGQEQQAALAAQSSGSSADTSGGAASAPTGDQIPVTSGGESVAAALEGLGSGLTQLQTQQANDEANAQSASDAAAQLSNAYGEITSLATNTQGINSQLVSLLGGAIAPAPAAPAPYVPAPAAAPSAPAPVAELPVAAKPAASPVPTVTTPPATVKTTVPPASVGKVTNVGITNANVEQHRATIAGATPR